MKQLHLAIQNLIAQKQASKTLEKRLMVQFNTARFNAEQRASMNVASSRANDRLLCKSRPTDRSAPAPRAHARPTGGVAQPHR